MSGSTWSAPDPRTPRSEGTVKVAWRRDPSVPAGQPATGTLRCTCGETVEGVSFGDGNDYPCPCGRTWDSRGWLVGGAA